ncbi:Hypothetical protein A7982_07633 [Minicystis rosea]|nr:Hypothetical protein A7982_07633 [Minicystis rosea]
MALDGGVVTSVASAVSAVSVGVGVGGSGGIGGVTVGVGGAGGGGGVGGAPPGPEPIGLWTFDDCNAGSTSLADSSGNGATATRSAQTTCTPGIDGLGIAFDQKKDIITVPSLSSFTFGEALTVSAWINPTVVTGTHPIINKRGGQTSFEFEVHGGDVEISIKREGASLVTSAAPISANKWSHVAAVYDGTFLFLFINGQQVGQVAGAGTIKNNNAPVRIGNNVDDQFFKGSIDQVALFDGALSTFEISQLACMRRPGTLAVNPPASGPVAPGTTVAYDVALTNNDVGACAPSDYFINIPFFEPDINVSANPQFVPGVGSGQTAHFSLGVTGSEEAEPGVHTVPFDIFNFSGAGGIVSGSVDYELTAPTGCFVRTNRELMIRDLSVVEDPIRTTSGGPAGDPRAGVWTFARLMEDMAPTPGAAPAMVEQMFRTWLTNQSINGFNVPARTFMQNLVIDPWPRSADGSLDLTRAPLRLLTVVNRIDVRNLAEGNAGEGRFVFGVLDPFGFQQQFTLILEYKLPATTEADVLDWANAWHALGALPFPSEQYNAALQAITTRFAGRNAAPGRPNGSALSQLRTNEIALSAPWELREFTLSATDGLLHPATVKLTPDLGFDGTSTLAAFINQNEADILVERHTVPDTFQGSPFLGGSSLNNLTAWTAPGILNNEARHKFSLNTCNGCHGAQETGTGFLHINPRDPGTVAQLSGFLTGVTLPDPVTGVPRTLNDLGRRNQDLKALVCPPPAGLAAKAASSTSVQRGIGRVH